MSSSPENYFQSIDSVDKAYWLGFIYADGCIVKNSLKFCLSLKDEERLHQFKLDSNGDINFRYYTRTLNYKNEKREYKCCDASWYSRKLIADLHKLGCDGSKTFRIRLPSLNSDLLYDAFLLGFYDGDGFQKGHVICSGNKEFLEDIKSHYNIPYDVKLKIHSNKVWSCYTLCIGWDLHSRIILSYSKSMPRKRMFKSRQQVYITVRRKILDGTWINPFTHSIHKHKRIELEDLGISLDEFKDLCKQYGVVKLSKMFNRNSCVIRRLCKQHDIHYSSQDRGNQQRRFEVTKEELEKLVVDLPMVKIGKLFGVSDNAIRKKCKKLGISIPQKRVWESSLKELEKGRFVHKELQQKSA